MARLSLFLAIASLATAQAIYPPDHWSFSTKLSNANADGFIKENIDAGKTVSGLPSRRRFGFVFVVVNVCLFVCLYGQLTRPTLSTRFYVCLFFRLCFRVQVFVRWIASAG